MAYHRPAREVDEDAAIGGDANASWHCIVELEHRLDMSDRAVARELLRATWRSLRHCGLSLALVCGYRHRPDSDANTHGDSGDMRMSITQ
jgi:hypothetical protein